MVVQFLKVGFLFSGFWKNVLTAMVFVRLQCDMNMLLFSTTPSSCCIRLMLLLSKVCVPIQFSLSVCLVCTLALKSPPVYVGPVFRSFVWISFRCL